MIVALTVGERELLRQGLDQWGGPARASDALARMLGFRDTAHFHAEADRVGHLLASGESIPAVDAVRALAATEIVFASDVFGAGVEWEIVTPYTDAETITMLREIQRKLVGSYHLVKRR